MAAIGRFLLILAIVAAPWVFGSVQPWPQFLLAAVVAALTFLRTLEAGMSRPEGTLHVPLASVAPLVLLLIAALQLLPRDVTPAAHMSDAVYTDAAEMFQRADHVASGTLSQSSTRREAARLYTAIAAFLLAAQWFATRSTHRNLLAAVAINGFVLGAFGIVQSLSWNGLLFWRVEMRFGGTPFASYVNRNNAAGYLNLCIGAAIGLGILLLTSHDGVSHRLSRLRDRIQYAISRIDGKQLGIVAVLAVLLTSILFSLSRGGVAGMVLATLAVGFTAFRDRSRKLLLAVGALIALSAVGILIFAGQLQNVDRRLDTLSNPSEAAAGRLRHWADTMGAVRDFPLLGTGFGTYRYANQPYQSQPAHAWYYNADNEWFELLVELGGIGLLAAAAGMTLIGVSSLWLLRRNDVHLKAVGAAGLYAVVSQSVQAVTDFGLIIPANGLTFAVLAGTVCGTAARAAEFEQIRIPLSLSLAQLQSRPSQFLLNGVLAVASAAFLLDLFTATMSDSARDHRVVIRPDETPIAQIDAAIAAGRRALALRPDDGELHQTLGNLYCNRCRVQLYQDLLKEVPNPDARERANIWRMTSLPALGARGRQLESAEEVNELNRLRSLPAVAENIGIAQEHYRQALRHCALLRGSALWLSRLAVFSSASTSSRNVSYMQKARFIAPSTPSVLLELAQLAFASEDISFADSCWRRALTLQPEDAPMVWQIASQDRTPQEVIENAIPSSVPALVEIADWTSDDSLRDLLIRHTETALTDRADSISHLTRAKLAELQSLPDVAIREYQLALSEQPWEIEAGLRLARILHREGRIVEAERQYKFLSQQFPNRKEIRDAMAALRRDGREIPTQPGSESQPE